MEAWNRWKTARAQLAEAIQMFSDACTVLEAAINNSLGRALDPLSADAAIQDAHASLPAFTNYFERLTHSRALLRRISNSSTTLVPINVLPTEILTYVLLFAMSSSCSISSDRSYSRYLSSGRESPPGPRQNPLISIMQTRSSWRQIILNTRAFWSHVDVLPNQSTNKSVVLSEFTLVGLRSASGIPLHLHFSPQFPRSRAKDLAAPLGLYLPGVVSLEFDSKCSLEFIQTIFDLYSTNGVSGCVKSFIYPHRSRELEHNQSGTLKWSPGLLAGIVDLTLGNLGKNNLALRQLAIVFASAPRIQTLRLLGVAPQPADEGYHPKPIKLLDLRLLDVNCRIGYSTTCFRMLSIIAPGLSGLDLRLHQPTSQTDFEITRSFLLRSNIKSFTCKLYEPANTEFLKQCVSFLPDLRGLFLISCYSNGSSSADPVPIDFLVSRTGRECSAAFPTIKVIGLVAYGNWGIEGVVRIREMVEAYSLNLLVLGSDYCPTNKYPKLEDWLSQHVKHISKPRSLFMEDREEYDRFIKNCIP